ncbi:MAG: HD-GYP domain-containing protein [Arcobacteraceae bacterium]|nr:HD-GYP domain-containing protein [Arcobacteraceae bacterium]
MSFKQIKLTHISLKALEMGHIYKYPIYYKKEGKVYSILIKEGDKFTSNTQEQINSHNITDVYVLDKDHDQYEFDTQTYLEKIVKDDSVPISLKSEILHEMAADVINDLLEGDINTQKIKQADIVVSDTVNLILDDPKAVKAMLKVTSHDYYTYTHSVNVSTYALGFGSYLKFNKEQLHMLGMAGIMHDVGKRKIPGEIINKDGKLTDDEFKIIQKHPSYGVEILKELGETNQVLLDIVEQHHEKIDGSGYPHALKGKDIHPYAQIMSIADIFDALTTKRSYKGALKSFEAFNIMHNHMKQSLNNKLLKKFMSFMSQ